MKRNKTAKQKLKNLIKTAKENPELRIVPLVDSECIISNDYNIWVAKWGETEIEEIYEEDDRIYIKSKDCDELIQKQIEQNNNINDKYDWEKEYKKAEKIIEGYEWQKVIVVNIISQ